MKLGRFTILIIFFVGGSIFLSGGKNDQSSLALSSLTLKQTIVPFHLSHPSVRVEEIIPFSPANLAQDTCADATYAIPYHALDTYNQCWLPVMEPFISQFTYFCKTCDGTPSAAADFCYGRNEAGYGDVLISINNCVSSGCENWDCAPGAIQSCEDGKGTQICEQIGCGADWGACRLEEIDNCEEYVGNPVNTITGEVTFQSSRPDVEISASNGSLTLVRTYSSLRAFDDYLQEGVHEIYTMFPVQSWGTGWYHQYEHTLFVGGNQADGSNYFVYREPDGNRVLFDENFKSKLRPSFSLSRLSEENLGDDIYILQIDDGSKLEFVRASLYSTSQVRDLSTPVFHLSQITEPSGRILTLQYYGATESSPCNKVEWLGKLCLITSDGGAFIHFSKYIKYSETKTDYRINEVQYGRYLTSNKHSKYYIVYEYTKKFRKPAASSYPVRVLTYVSYYSEEGVRFAPEIETYEYTNLSFFRPDLDSVNIHGISFENPFASQKHILARDGLDVWLLKVVRDYKKDTASGYDSGYEYVSGHEYDEKGRGVASIRAGEYLRIAYFYLGQDPLRPDQQITRVVNESKNNQTADYESLNGYLVKITGDCGCSLGKTESFERDNDSYTIAKRQQDPDPEDSSPGTRTVFTYDDKKRIIIQLDNWESAPPQNINELGTLLPASTALLNPIHVQTFEYAASTSSIPRIESRFFSVLCPYATLFGEICPSSYSPRTERVFDATGTRVNTETEYGLTFDPHTDTGSVNERQRIYTFTYVPNSSLIETITDPNQITRYAYYISPTDADPCVTSPSSNLYNSGQLKEVWLNNHLVQQYGDYNEKGLAQCEIDENGVKTSFVYDYAGKVLEQIIGYEGQTRKLTFSYRFDGQLVQNSDGNIYRNYVYYGRPTDPILPTSADFCSNQSDTVLRQNCLKGLGSLAQVTSIELGVKEQDGSNQPAKTTNSFYDNYGMPILVQSANPNGEIKLQTGYAYDQSGNLWQHYKYIDQLADPNNLSGSADFTKVFTYDALNQLRLGQDERFNQPNREIKYDPLGRIESVTIGLGTSEVGTTHYQYDTNDNIIKVTDPDGRVTDFLYDDFGQLSIVKAPDTGITKYLYDLGGNLKRILYSDDTTKSLEYDDRNRLISEQFQKSDTSEQRIYYYDTPKIYDYWALCPSHTPVRPPIQQNPEPTDNSNTRPPVQQTPSLTDSNIRPPINQNPAQPEVSQNFLMGRLSAVRHGAGWAFYSYTPFGEIEATYEWDGDQTNPCDWRITRYQYDDSGRLTSMTYPSGHIIRYVYNPEDLYPSRVELLVLDGQGGITTSVLFDNMSYDVDGNLAGYTAGQVTFSAQWDLAGQATQRNYQGAMGHDFNWVISSRDGNGNIESVGDVATNKNLTLTYDGQDRLKSAIGTNLRGYQDCSYVYDASGNRISENCYDKEITYSYKELSGGIKTNQLETLSWAVPNSQTGEMANVTREFTYDNLGRTTTGYTDNFPTEDERYTTTYDLAGLLQTIDINLDGLADYTYYYDHRNLRTQKTSQIGKTDYTYDLPGNILSVQDAGEVREYIWLNNQPIAMLVDNGDTVNPILKTYILGLDHLGTPMRAWDLETGEIKWSADYEAFGRAYEYTPNSPNISELNIDIRLPGQIYDKETSLHYNWYRWYDQKNGRYLQTEPSLSDPTLIPLLASASYPLVSCPYCYARNSPFVYIDSNGYLPTRDSNTSLFGATIVAPSDPYSLMIIAGAAAITPILSKPAEPIILVPSGPRNLGIPDCDPIPPAFCVPLCQSKFPGDSIVQRTLRYSCYVIFCSYELLSNLGPPSG